MTRPAKPRRKPTPEERVYRALFVKKQPGPDRMPLALVQRLYPDPRPQILAAIRAAMGAMKGKSRGD